ncbi:MAG TPA: hypothetical protein VL418_12005 [Devosiaceae bacterium]|nr:hypothetical protein [Devosiaceae bacterium]
MVEQRSIRRLSALAASGSSARVLNLPWVHKAHGHAPEALQPPLFHNRLLNRAIILKHRLRAHELENAPPGRSVVTKVLIPIDATDLRHGAHSFLCGQRDLEAALPDLLGPGLEPGSRDRRLLTVLDELPSLDPFLLREHLKLHGIQAADGYFNIADADVRAMHGFVEKELLKLVELGGVRLPRSASERLAAKLLSQDIGQLSLLKDTLRLSSLEYEQGMFAWRGFLYYKWVMYNISEEAPKLLDSILGVRYRGASNAYIDMYVAEARGRLVEQIRRLLADVGRTLGVYDRAYQSLTEQGDPTAFRTFLRSAPGMFEVLGQQLGAVQHVISFWNYRVLKGHRVRHLAPQELMDILLDFEESVACSPGGGDAAPAAARLGVEYA